MIIAMVAISALILGLCVYVGIRQVAQRRTPVELRGDWWSGFERDFRAYATHTARRPRRPQRPHGRADRPPAA